MTEYRKIIEGTRPPDPAAKQAGRDARTGGKEFHEGPKPHQTVEALSWRIGWNEKALELNAAEDARRRA